MARSIFSSLRGRLLLLVLLALLPAFGLILYTASEQRRHEADENKEHALRLARLAALAEEEQIHGARQLLVGLAELPAVRQHDSGACSARFADLLKRFPLYTTIAAARPNGDVFCSGVPLTGPVNIVDRPYFQRSRDTQGFSVGEYVLGRITGKAVLALAYPSVDESGVVQAVVFVGLSVAWLDEFAAEAQLPPGSALTVIDRHGVILARHPEPAKWVGESAAETPIVKTVRAQHEGVSEAPGVDGIPRLYGFTTLRGAQRGGDAHVWIGIPKDVAFAAANRNLALNLIGLGLVGVLALVAAWVGGDLLVLRRVNALVRATKRLGAGDLSARTGLPYGRGELGQLARSFDEMAESLEQATARRQRAEQELRRANRALRVLSACNQAVIRATEESELQQAVCHRIVDVGGYRFAWVGFAEPGGANRVRLVAYAGDIDSGTITGGETDREPIRSAIRSGQPAVASNIPTDPAFASWHADAARRGYASAAALPLMAAGQPFGVLAIYAAEPDAFDEQEMTLLTELAADLAYGIGALRARAEAKRAAERLAASEERARLVVETSNDGFISMDADGLVTTWNRRSEAIFGWSREEAIGRPLAEMVIPLQHREAHRRGIRHFLATGEGPLFDKAVELGALHRDGHEFPVEVTVWPIRLGEAYSFNAFVRDISERQRAEEDQRRLLAQLIQSQKLAAMGELLAGVAHELNNPLTVVMARAQLLSAMAEGRERSQAERIAKAGERCARIVKNFLALARQHPPERERVELNRVLQEAVELLAYPLRVDNVEVTFDLADDLPILWADPHQLHQVVVNLVTNAHHAMRETASPRRLGLASRFDPARARLTLEVADTGPGIPPEIQTRIFEPFFTTKPAGQGTGLGLSLCHGIIEGHGGAIRVESQPGGGATFLIELPLNVPPPGEPEARAAESLPAIRGKAILVVDDEPEVAAVLADLLAADGHRVETAANGALALDRLRERTYDLILSDLRMPELDGPGLYRELERHHPGLHRRVVFLTGDTLGPETREFLERTGVPSVSKPFALEEVRRAIQRVLRA